MFMNKNRTRCGGFLWAEMVVAIGLLGVVLTGLAVSLRGFALINDCQWARQRCTAAAQAQIDSLVATGRPIEREELQRLWPHVEVRVDRAPGAGPWEGLELLQVTATTQAGRRHITVHLARYLGRASPPAQTAGGRGGDARYGRSEYCVCADQNPLSRWKREADKRGPTRLKAVLQTTSCATASRTTILAKGGQS
jgi:hypothetical protein